MSNLDSYIANLKRQRSTLNKDKNKLFNNSDFLKKEIDKMVNLKKAIEPSKNNKLFTEFQKLTRQIRSNVTTRFERRFPSGSRRLSEAVFHSEFDEIKVEEDRYIYRVGNIDLLNERTSIFVRDDGTRYEPPDNYRITSWWIFWEYTGIGAPKHFKDSFTYRYVKSKGWTDRPRLEPRPFLLLQGDLFQEDKNAISSFGRIITIKVLSNIFKG